MQLVQKAMELRDPVCSDTVAGALYSNRSGTRYQLKRYDLALDDGRQVAAIKGRHARRLAGKAKATTLALSIVSHQPTPRTPHQHLLPP